MLAALIATRPLLPTINYGNQFVAATTLFLCSFLAKQAAALSTNPVFSYQLLFSTQGNESIVDSLDRLYYNIISPLGSTSPTFLSVNIAAVVVIAIRLNGLIQFLPVAPVNAVKLAEIQRRMGIALRLLRSLAIPITLNFT
jgi:hypothetical protein